MTLTRHPQWTTYLHDFLQSRLAMPFAWGSNDCALFITDAINSMTGTDFGAGLRGQYSSLASAAIQMATLTGKTAATVEDVAVHFATQANMIEYPNAKFAQRGDIVLFDSANGPALGIVYLDGVNAFFVSQDGINQVKASTCRRGWRV